MDVSIWVRKLIGERVAKNLNFELVIRLCYFRVRVAPPYNTCVGISNSSRKQKEGKNRNNGI